MPAPRSDIFRSPSARRLVPIVNHQLGSHPRRGVGGHPDLPAGGHYVRDVTFREDAQKARTGNLPANCAAIRNLVIGAARKAGFANIAHARRYYARDDQRILELYGYA